MQVDVRDTGVGFAITLQAILLAVRDVLVAQVGEHILAPVDMVFCSAARLLFAEPVNSHACVTSTLSLRAMS